MKSQNIFNKIVEYSKIDKIASTLKKSAKTIVFTNGCFDILHPGHIDLLAKCSEMGDYLIVGVNSDSSIKRLKGPDRPVNNQDARIIVLASLQFIDYLTIFDADTPIELIKKIKPEILVKGGDWDANNIVGSDFVRSYGGKVEIVPFIEGYSTSSIIEKIRKI